MISCFQSDQLSLWITVNYDRGAINSKRLGETYLGVLRICREQYDERDDLYDLWERERERERERDLDFRITRNVSETSMPPMVQNSGLSSL